MDDLKIFVRMQLRHVTFSRLNVPCSFFLSLILRKYLGSLHARRYNPFVTPLPETRKCFLTAFIIVARVARTAGCVKSRPVLFCAQSRSIRAFVAQLDAETRNIRDPVGMVHAVMPCRFMIGDFRFPIVHDQTRIYTDL